MASRSTIPSKLSAYRRLERTAAKRAAYSIVNRMVKPHSSPCSKRPWRSVIDSTESSMTTTTLVRMTSTRMMSKILPTRLTSGSKKI